MVERQRGGHGQHDHIFMELIKQGVFEIDERGVMWRLKSHRGKGYFSLKEKREITGTNFSEGYIRVYATVAGDEYSSLVHRLIWAQHNGPIPEELEINHKNGIKSDNRLENIEIVTPHKNVLHAHRTGLVKRRRMLTEADVVDIRTRASHRQATLAELAKEYDCDRPKISKIVKGRRYSYYGGPITKDDLSRKIAVDDIEVIRKLYSEGASPKELASRYGVSRTLIDRYVSDIKIDSVGIRATSIPLLEEWRIHPHNSNVLVSSSGQVQYSGQIKRIYLQNRGYPYVAFDKKGHPIHRLVAETFISDIPKGDVVHHIDGNKANNNLSNLEIISSKLISRLTKKKFELVGPPRNIQQDPLQKCECGAEVLHLSRHRRSLKHQEWNQKNRE